MPTAFETTFDGKKMLVTSKKKFAIVEVKEKQTFEKPIALDDIEVPVDPRAEWRQLFVDTYRFERDFFYDPGMHGVNWDAMKERYMSLLDDAVTRWDVNWIIGEFLGELNASHTYHGGGDLETGLTRSIGMLGVDWELAGGAYRIKRIVRGGPWDTDIRSPLDEPGVNVKEGDYVLAVNGRPLDTKADPWASFEDLGKKTVVLTVGNSPSAAARARSSSPAWTTRSSSGSARGSRSGGRSSTKRPAARPATSTSRAPAPTRRTS